MPAAVSCDRRYDLGLIGGALLGISDEMGLSQWQEVTSSSAHTHTGTLWCASMLNPVREHPQPPAA